MRRISSTQQTEAAEVFNTQPGPGAPKQSGAVTFPYCCLTTAL